VNDAEAIYADVIQADVIQADVIHADVIHTIARTLVAQLHPCSKDAA